MISHFSRVQLFATPWTVARQSPLSIEFSKQEYWSGSPCPPPGDLPNLGIELESPVSLELAGEFFATEPLGVSLKRFTVTLKEMLWVFVTVQAFSSCGAWASHCCGFSCCQAQALGHMGFSTCSTWAQNLWLKGSRVQVQ